MSGRVAEPTITKISYFSNTVYLLTPSLKAIGPYVRLFNTVKSEHTKDSKINRNGSFKKYMLGKYYAFVHLARQCIRNREMLRECNIIPLRSKDEYGNCNQPFWFPIFHTRFDNAKHTEREICDNFWKCFGGFGVKLVHLGMSFDDLRNNINRIIEAEMTHAFKVRVTTGDVVLSCRHILGRKRPGYYGRSNWLEINREHVGTVNKSVYNRARISDEDYKKHVLRRFSRPIVEYTRYPTKPPRKDSKKNSNHNSK